MRTVGQSRRAAWYRGLSLTKDGSLHDVTDTGLVEETVPQESLEFVSHPMIPTGYNDYSANIGGYLIQDSPAFRSLSGEKELGPLVIFKTGRVVGRDATLARSMGIKSFNWEETSMNNLARISFELYRNEDAGVYPDSARILANGDAIPMTHQLVDMGTGSITGSVINVQLDDVVWDGATALDIQVRHGSNSDGSSTAAYGSAFEFTPGTPAATTFFTTRDSTTDMNRYATITVNWTGGTNPSARLLVVAVPLR